MSFAVKYRENLMINPSTPAPRFLINVDRDRRCFVRLTVDGLIISQDDYSNVDHAAKLRYDDAIRLRDWLTKMFEDKSVA